jgi:hypothetical protein
MEAGSRIDRLRELYPCWRTNYAKHLLVISGEDKVEGLYIDEMLDETTSASNMYASEPDVCFSCSSMSLLVICNDLQSPSRKADEQLDPGTLQSLSFYPAELATTSFYPGSSVISLSH